MEDLKIPVDYGFLWMFCWWLVFLSELFMLNFIIRYVYSLGCLFCAGRYLGRRKKSGPGEWIFYHAKIPRLTCKKTGKKFNPAKFNADAWIKLASTNPGERGFSIRASSSRHMKRLKKYGVMRRAKSATCIKVSWKLQWPIFTSHAGTMWVQSKYTDAARSGWKNSRTFARV